MLLYVTIDTKTWAKAQFPHASSAKLRENAYTLVESTTHSLAVDVVLQDQSTIGTLFVSNSNGTFFVQSLKDTNRNEMGFVDYERIYGLEGIGIANVVLNAADVEGRGEPKQLKSLITFDDGSNWGTLRAPARDSDGKKVHCDPDDKEKCSLHLHSVTTPRNFGRIFSSPAPGFVMGVGSIGHTLLPYEESDTFLSTDGGVTWNMARFEAHKYEFGDSGSILVVVNDEEAVSEVRYSLDLGTSWYVLSSVTCGPTHDFAGRATTSESSCAPAPSLPYPILLPRNLFSSVRFRERISRKRLAASLSFSSTLRRQGRGSARMMILRSGMQGLRNVNV
jgi:hypothetical protein